VVMCLATVSVANQLNTLESRNQVKDSPPFSACVDDSDCKTQGIDFACFQYICYPWEDDSNVAAKDKFITCKSDDDCSSGLQCFRHHNRRNIHKGLCLEESIDCREGGKDDCKAGESKKECCNGQYCCDKSYHTQLLSLPCVSDEGCQDMGYGNYCCPPKGNSTSPGHDTCCNEDPNPTTTTTTTTTTTKKPVTPKAQKKTSGAESLSSVFFLSFVMSLLLLTRH